MRIYVAKNNQRTGPYSAEEVQEKVAMGELAATDLGWHEELENWTPLNAFLSTPPPLPPPPPEPPAPMYFYIPTSRLVGMSLVAPGIFGVYWFYMNWLYLKKRQGLEAWPFWRAFFGVFWVYALFRSIRKDGEAGRIKPATFSPDLAAGWIGLTLLGNVVSRLGNIWVCLGGIALGYLAVFCVVPVQQYINALNEAREPRPRYHEWSAGHIICLGIGMTFWGIMLLGLAAEALGLAPTE